MNPTDFPLTQLSLWIDEQPREGPENMAVDEWLLETVSAPVLRIYRWEGSWISLGCFGRISEVPDSVQNVRFVRRLTGGGIVDHQRDWTYTLVIPGKEKLAQERGAESYRIIHQALVGAIAPRFNPMLSDGNSTTGAAACFENPVRFDLVIETGEKLAGAGQRRTKNGLLHQGSVAMKLDALDSIDCSKRLASRLAAAWKMGSLTPIPADLERRMTVRYGNPEWTHRR
jgi:lipoate-protein ligase A